MAAPAAQSVRFTCPICLTAAVLPDTVPFGEDLRCALCLNVLRRYLPCVECERSFDPHLPVCPGCGVRPPDEALTNPAYRIANRVLAEALAAARQAALPAPTPAAPAKPDGEHPEAERQWEWKRPTGAQTSGDGQ